DLLTVEHAAEISCHQVGLLIEALFDQNARNGGLFVIYIAQRDALDVAVAQHGAKISLALTAATDQADTDAAIGPNDFILRESGLNDSLLCSQRRKTSTCDAGARCVEVM